MTSPQDSRIVFVESKVRPYYAHRDSMHGLDHIRRILRAALQLREHYPAADREVTLWAAYLHGMVDTFPAETMACLEESGLSAGQRQHALQAAHESYKDVQPATLEGQILHDAHLIEGGPTFLLVKSLVTGTERGQSLSETLDFIERHLLGRFACVLPEAQAIYAQKERYAREALASLRAHL